MQQQASKPSTYERMVSDISFHMSPTSPTASTTAPKRNQSFNGGGAENESDEIGYLIAQVCPRSCFDCQRIRERERARVHRLTPNSPAHQRALLLRLYLSPFLIQVHQISERVARLSGAESLTKKTRRASKRADTGGPPFSLHS